MLWGEQASPQASTRVIHTDEAGPEREPPSDLPELFHAFGEERGDRETEMRVYPQALLKAYALDSVEDPGFDGDEDDRKAFEVALTASIERALGTPLPVQSWTAAGTPEPREYLQEIRSCEHRNLECPIHQMLGFGKNVQGTAADARDDGDILLLQLDSDLKLHEHFMFCDVGVAQFWIKPEDLAEKRFEKAWATTEGG